MATYTIQRCFAHVKGHGKKVAKYVLDKAEDKVSSKVFEGRKRLFKTLLPETQVAKKAEFDANIAKHLGDKPKTARFRNVIESTGPKSKKTKDKGIISGVKEKVQNAVDKYSNMTPGDIAAEGADMVLEKTAGAAAAAYAPVGRPLAATLAEDAAEFIIPSWKNTGKLRKAQFRGSGSRDKLKNVFNTAADVVSHMSPA